MADKKGLNPLAIGLGLALGAAGAMFLSKKENRAKVSKAVKKLKDDKGKNFLGSLNQMFSDVENLSNQKDLDKEVKRRKK